ncbi:ABC transporter permease [Secundilactobacillus kimchicus]|uniref:ABC transporter permease n=1 Tax=Secundilactobacillus kimchicus TaxID=528209 RepID=UPI0024A7E7EB|nr:ABC transporter permease [Secundilactobacillus kimchicus]
MSKFRFKWSNVYLLIVFLILYAPIAFLIFYSFNSGTTMDHFDGFTLQHYGELLADSRLIAIVLNTLLIALLSALLATTIGTMGALWIDRLSRPFFKNTVLSLNNILIVSPDVIIGASFLIFFTMLHVPLGFSSVLLSHIAFSIPIVVLMVLPRLREMNRSMLDAAADLGANRRQIFSSVILPFITPGIFSGFFMALTYSLDDFAVTFFVTGNGFSTLSVEIYSRARQGISLEINALSALMFIVTLIMIVGYYFVQQSASRRRRREAR